jgi:uncharacterized protein (DUF305 family)
LFDNFIISVDIDTMELGALENSERHNMNRKLLVYSLAGLLAGNVATGLVTLALSKAAPQTILATGTTIAQAQPTSPQSLPSGSVYPGGPGTMNRPEQHFIVMMIPHHDGAIAMADLALSRAQHPEIKQLAKSIKTTQTREIQKMRDLYKQWYGTEVPAWGPGRVWNWTQQPQGNNQQPVWGPGMGMYRDWDDWDQQWGSRMGCCMHGGWSGTNLSALNNAPDFDREFIQQMIPHHQMGVMMAQMVLSNSQRSEIQKLAQAMIDAQTAEINQMQQWYRQWYQ